MIEAGDHNQHPRLHCGFVDGPFHLLDAGDFSGATLAGRPRAEGREAPSVHFFTPETETTTHFEGLGTCNVDLSAAATRCSNA
jgi:hypothetical protein